MKKTLTALPLFFISIPAFSSDVSLQLCEQNRGSQVEYMRCLDRQIATLENQIKLWENNKVFELEEFAKVSGRGDALRTFKKSAKSFSTFANQHCRWQYAELLPDTIAAARKYKECTVEVFNQRVIDLKRVAKAE